MRSPLPSTKMVTNYQHPKTDMKTLSLLLTSAFLSAAVLHAQDQQQTTTTTTTRTTTYGNGTITEYVPGTTFIVKESTGPVTYRYGKKSSMKPRAARSSLKRICQPV